MNRACLFVCVALLTSGGGNTSASSMENQLRATLEQQHLPTPEMKKSNLSGGMVLLRARNDRESLNLRRKLAKSGFNLKKVLVVNPLLRPWQGKSNSGVTVKLHLPGQVRQGDRVPFSFEVTNHTGETVKGYHGMCDPGLQLTDPSTGWAIHHSLHNRPCPTGLELAEIKAGGTLKLEGFWEVMLPNSRPLPTGTYQVQAGMGLSPSVQSQKGFLFFSQKVTVQVRGKP